MTDHDDHDTEAAPTEQASPPTKELPQAEHAETPEAWSPDDVDEDYSPPPPKRYLRVTYATILALILAGLLISTIATFFTPGSSKQAGPAAKPSTTAAVNTPPSAPTVAPSTGPTVNPTPVFSTYDEKFLSLMTQEGWSCTDNSAEEQCKNQIISFAHQVCTYSGQSIDRVYQDVGFPAFLGPGEEHMAIANAELAYPNCTITESP